MKTKLNTKPDFTAEPKYGMFNCIVKIDNPFLQALADAGAMVMSTGDDFWIMTNIGQLWLKIFEDRMHLECIAVQVKDRKQGRGTQLMELLTQISDETGISISLEVSNVTVSKFGGGHHVAAIGSNKKDKIPVAALPKWYQKFGFTKSPSYTAKKKEMIYKPKNK